MEFPIVMFARHPSVMQCAGVAVVVMLSLKRRGGG